MIDFHTHTNFSFDSELDPEVYIRNARDRGLEHLAVTDHMDADTWQAGGLKMIDYKVYFNTFSKLRQKYGVNLAIGIECGYTPDNINVNKTVIEGYDFEYIINSVHTVDGEDCYFPGYFNNKNKAEAYNQYFETVLKSLDAPYRYDTVGHMTYITRNAPYPDQSVEYKASGGIIDCILKKIIAKNIILEVNANITTISPHTPDTVILKRYREMGGELITYGSDAHTVNKLVQNYKTVTESIKSCGFKYLTAKRGEKITQVKI